MPSEDSQLIAVIEVPEDKKVLCQSEGCGRSVYKSVHIVKLNGKLQIVGSECFKKYIGKQRSQEKLKPLYGSSDGIHLSEHERDLLLQNTEQLIAEFEAKYNNEKAREPSGKMDYSHLSDVELRKLALKITKDDFRKNKGLNPEMPGWAGWVKSDAETLYKQLKEKQK
ncbi:hypothetical protein [Methylomicrobium lacus]|uniref:hypothetical protein n=1 Tax=Methylomicrobium lacus TaxID=136992 RepID=UPI0035A8189B